MSSCKNCKKVNIRERDGIRVAKYCTGCCMLKKNEKKEKHKLTKTYQKSRYKTLHKKAWTLFSEWIRRKDTDSFGMVSCYTCNVKLHYKESNASHYFHGKLDFDARNMKVCCVSCNLYKSGNLAPYGVRLCAEIGVEGMQQLRLDSNTVTYSNEDLERIIEEYTHKLSEL